MFASVGQLGRQGKHTSRTQASRLASMVRGIFVNGGLSGIWHDPFLPYLFQDSAGTTPVTAVGQPVGKWSDRSGSGNHALQATAAARPVLSIDKALEFDGVDDFLATVAGGGGSAGFFFCTWLIPTGGAGTTRTLFNDVTGNNGYRVRINAANQLSFGAANGTAFTLASTVGTLPVAVKQAIMVWDDGTNLNAQIGGGAVASTPRPVVTAGQAAIHMGRDSGGATSFYAGDFGPIVYVKNSGLTAAQRATVQSYIKAQGGL